MKHLDTDGYTYVDELGNVIDPADLDDYEVIAEYEDGIEYEYVDEDGNPVSMADLSLYEIVGEASDDGYVYVDENGNEVDINDGAFEYIIAEDDYVPKGGLNRLFHYADRGGSLGGEILAGISMFLLSICVIFMNMQLIGTMLTAGVELSNSPLAPVNIETAQVYASLYAGSVLASVVGTILVGVLANLPLAQVSTSALASSLLCLVETGSGLSLENVLFVNLVAGAVYAVVVLIPGLRSFAFGSLPQGVRRGLPVAAGALLTYVAVRATGLFATGSIDVGVGLGAKQLATMTGLEGVSTSGIAFCALVGSAVALAIFVVLSLVKKGRPVLFALLGGTIVFAVMSIVNYGTDVANAGSYINFGRIWLVAGSQASPSTPFGDSYLTYAIEAIQAAITGISTVVSRGMDFSAYSGNSILLIASGVLSYLFMAAMDTEAALVSTADAVNKNLRLGHGIDASSEKAGRGIKAANALANVCGALLGAGAMTTSATVAGSRDRGKSGLAALVCALLMIVSLFVMAFPALLASSTYPVTSMNQWNYFAYGNGGFVYLVRGAGFLLVDVVVALVGLSMFIRGLKGCANTREVIAALVMAICAAVTLNIVIGVAAGLLVYILISIPANAKGEQAFGIGSVVLEVLLVAAAVLL